ncbi:CPBP family intramembrane metalloprotease [Bacillus salacetis]|uniref:CPBP family intramembrane metalloprotease n=1 Tax=Bacillus salacetis TaxID=2315464 RepID=A0A3A1R5F0_9BACI|nr:type II CAAX endopeptidase family protein [Bacillus salacetis]RIW38426.1 CPBP family intramembrane metalloprotease [Bacillus salacetis]
MKKVLLLLGPTLMIFIGLTLFANVPLTFGLFYGWLLLVPSIVNMKQPGLFKWRINFTKHSVILGTVSGLLFMILIFASVSYLFSFLIDLEFIRALLKKWNFDGGMVWLLIAVLIVLNPFLEENYWRNFIPEELKSSFSSGKSILIASFFYSFYHILSLIELFNWPFNVIAVLPVFLAGAIWGFIRQRTGSLAAPVLSHMLADAGIMLVYLVHIHVW